MECGKRATGDFGWQRTKTPTGAAVDANGNVYIADTNDNAIKEYSGGYLLLGSGPTEPATAGPGSVAVTVLPSSLPVSATSSAGWLTITGTSGGLITFSLTANTAASSRTAQVTTYGQSVTVTQSGDSPSSVTIVAGNSQTAVEKAAFTTALEVKVKDAAGNAISGALVTFTVVPGSNGAAGTFASSAAVATTSAGLATASKLTAGGIAGSFTVTATAGGASATFHLTVAK